MKIKLALLCASSLTLSGCLGVHGMDPIIGLRGYPTQTIEQTLFSQDFAKAYCARSGGVSGLGQECASGTGDKGILSTPTPSPTPTPVIDPTPTQDKDDPHVRPMLRSGMMYVRTYCNDYFRTMAVEQRRNGIIRDSLAPITAVITGLAGIRNLSLGSDIPENDVLTSVALLSTASAAVLDIYDEHLLFGSENIDSVRTLTMKSLEVHKLAVLKKSGYSFEDAVEILVEHQNICAPQAMLAATRKAIKSGNPTTETVEDDDPADNRNGSPTPTPTPSPTPTPTPSTAPTGPRTVPFPNVN